MAKISEGFSIQKLLDGGGVEFSVQLKDSDSEQFEDDGANGDVEEALLKFQNLECLDNDEYHEGEPFEMISKKMVALLPDGGVQKRIIREGYGEKPPNLSIVRVDYNAYIEYEPVPFDSTYSRNRNHEFIINNGDVLLGLDVAVQSMKLNEKSQFLITPQYAYGQLGCLGRVPQNATVLFEVELHDIVDSGHAIAFNKLSDEEKNNFEQVYKYCLSLCVRASRNFKCDTREAVKEYNTAIDKLEKAEMQNYEEQEKQQELLFRLYTNLVVCYTKLEQPKKACLAVNKIFQMAKGTTIIIKPKVYYCHAKCLRLLGHFDQARKKLEIAYKMAPNNPDVANEFLLLKQDIDEKNKRDKLMAEGLK